MRKLLNTFFVTSEDIYLALDGENVAAKREQQVLARYPLHTLNGIITFSYAGASPGLMGLVRKGELGWRFVSPAGNFWRVYAERAAGMCFCAGNSTGTPTTRKKAV